MATRAYDLNRGQTDGQVVEGVGGATAGGGDVEFTVDLTKNLSKEDVLLAIDKIYNWIYKGIWPPA